MLDHATRKKSRGAQSRIIEAALVNHLGPKCPELLERYQKQKVGEA